MFSWIKTYFSKEAKKERALYRAKARERNASLRKLKKQFTALEEASRQMEVVGNVLVSDDSGQKEVIALDFAISRLLWAFRSDANWFDDPQQDRAELMRFIQTKFIEDLPITRQTTLVAQFGTLIKAILQVFYADSFKIAVTYSGLSQQDYNGRFEMWKHDARKAVALFDLLKLIPEQNVSIEVQNIIQTGSVLANQISAYEPSGEIPEFDYSVSQTTALSSVTKMAYCVPKNKLAKDRNLPVGRTIGGSASTIGIFGSGQVQIIPYTWLSSVFNKIKSKQFRDFLVANGMMDAVKNLIQQVEKEIEEGIQQTKQRIAEISSAQVKK